MMGSHLNIALPYRGCGIVIFLSEAKNCFDGAGESEEVWRGRELEGASMLHVKKIMKVHKMTIQHILKPRQATEGQPFNVNLTRIFLFNNSCHSIF